MRSEKAIRRWLGIVESEMEKQSEACMKTGWDSSAGLCWDRRCVQRATLRRILGLKEEPFNAADTMAGW